MPLIQAAIKKQLQPGLHKESSNIVRAVISSIWEILPVLNTLAANDALLVSTTAINTMGVLDSLTHQKMDSTESKLMRYASSSHPAIFLCQMLLPYFLLALLLHYKGCLQMLPSYLFILLYSGRNLKIYCVHATDTWKEAACM